MSAISNTPENKNFLSPLNFRFTIKKAPHVNFFIQKVTLPQITINPTPVYPTPFVDVPLPGEQATYSPLSVTFKVDEDMQDYLEIFNWIIALSDDERDGRYKALSRKPSYTGEGIYSDLSLMVLSSTKMPNYEVVFQDAFPITLSAITMNTTDETVNYLEATAEFRYTSFDISKV